MHVLTTTSAKEYTLYKFTSAGAPATGWATPKQQANIYLGDAELKGRVLIDNAGDAYVVNEHRPDNYKLDLLFEKYSASGDSLWQTVYDNVGVNQFLLDLKMEEPFITCGIYESDNNISLVSVHTQYGVVLNQYKSNRFRDIFSPENNIFKNIPLNKDARVFFLPDEEFLLVNSTNDKAYFVKFAIRYYGGKSLTDAGKVKDVYDLGITYTGGFTYNYPLKPGAPLVHLRRYVYFMPSGQQNNNLNAFYIPTMININSYSAYLYYASPTKTYHPETFNVSPYGNVYVGGNFASDSDPNTAGLYLQKYSACPSNTSPNQLRKGNGEPEAPAVGFGLRLAPNPATERVEVLLPTLDTGEASISIADVIGKRVLHTLLPKVADRREIHEVLDISLLKPGLYVVNVYIGDKKHSVKLVVE